MNIFIFTASNKAAREHLHSSITSSVNEELISKYLSPTDSFKADNGAFYCWGATPGTNNIRNWEKMKQGDVVLIYYESHLHFHSTVIDKVHNSELAKEIWDTDSSGETWEYMYFLQEPKEISPPINVKEHEKYFYQFRGFTPLSDERQNLLEKDYGDIFSFLEQSHQKKGMPQTEPSNKAETVMSIKNYINKCGFKYSYRDLSNFYLSLKSKPFVILAGISGTGKTQLPRMFAKAVGMKEDQIIQVPVRPDWTDGSDLLGYTGLNEMFQPKGLTLAIKKAKKEPQKPYFFILDEMNLARVEHYFSEFLSVIETRQRDGNNGITTDPILREEMIVSAENSEDFKDLRWPENLYLIGTVNMDETTFSFSRKVLDRANTVEMNQVDLRYAPEPEGEPEAIESITNSFFKTEYINSTELTNDDRENLKTIIELLIEINEILREGDLHFAYRVRDEISFYMTMNRNYGLLSEEKALDYQIMQKVLPRIHGSSIRVQRILVKLLRKLNGLKELDENAPDLTDNKDLTKRINKSDFPRSGNKLLFMLQRFEEDRFTSFWV